MLTLTVVLAVVVGVTLGLLGGGGSILLVPLLVYVAGLDAKEAIAPSLVVVGVTSAVSVVGHASVRRLVARVPAEALRRGLGWFVLAMGAVVLVQSVPDDARLPVLLLVGTLGAAMGTCSAFVARCPLRSATARA